MGGAAGVQQQQHTPAGAPTGGGGGAEGMTQQQILGVLQDPAKMLALLQANPALAHLLQPYLPAGYQLPLHR
ncbi:hypothetical protein HaLaN_11820 [Haematococcus lacustris]|uniref:Uncharacterized protein n=1 Tax=Haematococcus lacustris TaxID=44745 RepID=A0A699ZIQ4_HAELA|nr:hypothetical protein HaLaN_11820 [Haematococcus lacustris]